MLEVLLATAVLRMKRRESSSMCHKSSILLAVCLEGLILFQTSLHRIDERMKRIPKQ